MRLDKNLIVTAAIGYYQNDQWVLSANGTLDMINPFIKSLDKTSFQGDLMILSYDSIEIDYKTNFNIINRIVSPDTIDIKFNTINNLRPFFYKQILDQFPQYSNILFTDSRDVIFQSNPFDYFEEKDLIHFGMEENSIGNCKINSYWIYKLYGEEYTIGVLNETILNGGIIFGNREKLIEFFEIFTTELLSNSHLDTGNIDFIMEQSIPFNYALKFPEKVKKHYTNKSRFATMGHTQTFTMNRDGLILNDDRVPYVIVHQYDRLHLLEKIIRDMYV